VEATSTQNQTIDVMSDDGNASIRYVEDLVSRASAGDETTLPAIREWLLKVPGVADRLGGNLAATARRCLIDKVGGTNHLVKESLTRKLEELRDELAGPTPVERLLVDRIVTCWLHLHHLELRYAEQDNMSLSLATYYGRSLDRAQKRYLSAIKALAQVRRLALPILQLNIAKRQVNVAGSCSQ
jgi:hypothetical protein